MSFGRTAGVELGAEVEEREYRRRDSLDRHRSRDEARLVRSHVRTMIGTRIVVV